jgi:arsenate reductase
MHVSQGWNDNQTLSFRTRDKASALDFGRWSRFVAHSIDQRLVIEGEMKASIHHNPMCGTSRKTLEILQDSGADLTITEYLKTPPTRNELKRLYARAGISPREGLRAKEPLAAELGLTGPDISDDAILDAMVNHPILIERPIVETDKGVRLCRPQDKVREIL